MDKQLGFYSKKKRYLLFIGFLSIILMISIACALPFEIVWTGNTEDDQVKTDQTSTEVARKLTAEPPKLEEGSSTEGDEVDQAEEEIPSETPSPSPSPTETLTPTPEQLTAFIKKNTNCRIGPKDVFELIHILANGDMVDLLGKNEGGTFWYVKDQDEGEIECWIWTEYADSEGNPENLPIFTPPPEPPPVMNFVLSYKTTTGEANIHVYVRNTGNVALQSYTATFKDTVTSETLVVSGNKFGTAAKVSVGNTGVVSSGQFSASIIDHKISVTVKACSEDGQAGKCLGKTVTIKSE